MRPTLAHILDCWSRTRLPSRNGEKSKLESPDDLIPNWSIGQVPRVASSDLLKPVGLSSVTGLFGRLIRILHSWLIERTKNQGPILGYEWLQPLGSGDKSIIYVRESWTTYLASNRYSR